MSSRPSLGCGWVQVPSESCSFGKSKNTESKDCLESQQQQQKISAYI